MSKSEFVGALVVFTGFTGDAEEGVPDNGELLVEGNEYTVASEVVAEDGADPSYMLQVENPAFNSKKRKSKVNTPFLLVDLFPDEFSLASDVDAAEDELDDEAEDAPATIAYADVKKGMVITVDDGDEEGAITGTVVKVIKTKLTIDDGGEDQVEIPSKDIVSIVAADEAPEETEPEEAPAKKTAAKAKPAAKTKAAAKPAAKAAAKPAAKTKAKPAAKAKDPADEDEDLKGVIILAEDEEDSEILDLVNEADDLCELAHEMAEDSAAQDYRLGGVLYHVQISKEYKALDKRYEEKGGFALYVSEVLGLGYRKALYLVEIYTKFNKFGISSDKVALLGWTKAQVIASAMGQDNAEQLVELAETSTVSDLKDSIKETYGNKPGEKGDVVKRTSFKFRLLEDAGQAVSGYMAQAKEQLGATDDDAVFEHIVSEWAQEHLTVPKSRTKAAPRTKTSTAAKPVARRTVAA